MCKKLWMKILSVRIERRWFLIMRCRQKGKMLLDMGPPYTSKEILRLSKFIDRLCCRIWQLESKYMSQTENQSFSQSLNDKTACNQKQMN